MSEDPHRSTIDAVLRVTKNVQRPRVITMTREREDDFVTVTVDGLNYELPAAELIRAAIHMCFAGEVTKAMRESMS